MMRPPFRFRLDDDGDVCLLGKLSVWAARHDRLLTYLIAAAWLVAVWLVRP